MDQGYYTITHPFIFQRYMIFSADIYNMLPVLVYSHKDIGRLVAQEKKLCPTCATLYVQSNRHSQICARKYNFMRDGHECPACILN
jgi:hypothetical protein